MEDPFQQFKEWFELAERGGDEEFTAMSLATVNAEHKPSVRMVLLKTFDERGFVFFTNEGSRKAHDYLENKNAALCFFWPAIDKQIRIEGVMERTSDAESDEYFEQRARISQVGAWASKQSEILSDTATLERRVAEFEEKFKNKPVPRPAHWGGFRIVPTKIEFWQEREYRLHHRELFEKQADGTWKKSLLYP